MSRTGAAAVVALVMAAPMACGAPGSSQSGSMPGSSTGSGSGSSSGTVAGSGSGTTSGSSGTSSGTSSGSGSSSSGSSSSSSSGSNPSDAGSGTVILGGGGAACTGNESVAGGFPTGFWDATNLPTATGAVMFKFLNRTNGKYSDSELYWSFQNTKLNVNETHSLADQPTYDMPAPPAGGGYNGRMYFYICPTGSPASCPGSNGKTDYYDFIEFAIGNNSTPPPYWINYDTTRVDAFAIKLALDLHVTSGSTTDYYTGENCDTFAEDRDATFASYVASVPAEFQPCGQPPNAPYRIPEPGGGCGFNAGGANADYFNSYEMEMWTNNGITIPMPGPNGSGLGAYPDLSAAIMRHVGAAAGTFTSAGKLVNGNFWSTMPESTFYTAAPADYYAQWIHSRAIHGKQYAFPYDDVGGNSSDVGASGMEYMLVAIGW